MLRSRFAYVGFRAYDRSSRDYNTEDSDRRAISQQLADIIEGQKVLTNGQKDLANAAKMATEVSQSGIGVWV